MRTLRDHSIYVYIVLCFLSITPAMAAEQKKWDASEVLNLSDELFLAARKLRVECRSSPPQYIEADSYEHFQFRYHVSHFMGVSGDLSQALEDGGNKIETQPIYNNLVNIMRDLDRYAGRKVGGAWPPVSNAVLNADNYLKQLALYYSQ